MKEIAMASEKLQESCKDMEKNQKLFADKANEKYKVLKEGMEKLMKRDWLDERTDLYKLSIFIDAFAHNLDLDNTCFKINKCCFEWLGQIH